ncbi:DNA-binding XRE family transcriptional regulator [Bacillus oleivorans]|uniref:DNA-binding XRE family transcriptional regulator n=1 Tax=Bacillus oleivorans TaxID=1448271 RepID=A0A285CXZ8_9BACI|nr:MULTISPECIES: helix-turn-helix transcriptional regulator [Bacillus]SNX72285.1 DNA-binding XRE family transcriptional regulator [Bacillus oleivorans]
MVRVEEKRKLEAKRIKMNMKQEEIAGRVGISRQHYNRILNGKRKPSVELAKQLGTILNVEWTIFFID